MIIRAKPLSILAWSANGHRLTVGITRKSPIASGKKRERSIVSYILADETELLSPVVIFYAWVA